MTRILFLMFLMIIANHVQANIDSNPLIRTSSGILVGETITIDTNALVHRFLGVPYAQPPVEQNRFEKPKQIINQSDRILFTQQTKSTCIQMKHLSKTISPLLDVDHEHNVRDIHLYLV